MTFQALQIFRLCSLFTGGFNPFSSPTAVLHCFFNPLLDCLIQLPVLWSELGNDMLALTVVVVFIADALWLALRILSLG